MLAADALVIVVSTSDDDQESMRLEGFERAMLQKMSARIMGDAINIKFFLLSYPYVSSLPQARGWVVDPDACMLGYY